MNQTVKLLSILLSGFLLFSTCKKEVPACSGNCETINANGQVINKLTGGAASGVTVSLNWVKGTELLSSEVIQSVSSKSDGYFNFISGIDTTYFDSGYTLSLSAEANCEYMILGYSGVISKRIASFDQSAFQDIQLEVYKEANLQVRLHRTQNDDFQSFSVSHSNVVNNFFIYDYNIQSPQKYIYRKQNELNIKTVPDVYTKIKYIKTLSDGTSGIIVDSIKCDANSVNTYDINF